MLFINLKANLFIIDRVQSTVHWKVTLDVSLPFIEWILTKEMVIYSQCNGYTIEKKCKITLKKIAKIIIIIKRAVESGRCWLSWFWQKSLISSLPWSQLKSQM